MSSTVPVPSPLPTPGAMEERCQALHGTGAPRLPPIDESAWMGLMIVHSELTRALEADLIQQFGFSLSALDVLARIAWNPEGRLRMSDLAESARLSQSRVSRLVDELASRGLVERRACPSDSRGVFAHITDEGRALTHSALELHWARVREMFLDQLEGDEVQQLAAIWTRLLGRCPSAEAGQRPTE